MLKWVLMAAGAALTIWGYWWGWTGWSIVEVERGWSAVISGATVFAAGVVTLAIGLACWHIERIADQMRAALDRMQVTAAGPARSSTQLSAAPEEPAVAGSALASAANAAGSQSAPATEVSASENQLDLPLVGPVPAQDESPSADAKSADANARPANQSADKASELAADVAAAQDLPKLADNESCASESQTRAPHERAPEAVRLPMGRPRVPTQLRVIAGDGPDAAPPAAPQTADVAADKTPESAMEEVVERAVETAAQARAGSSSAPDQGAAAPPPLPLRPMPPLAAPPARADWPAPPPGAIPPPPGVPLTPPRMPAAAVPPVLTPPVAPPTTPAPQSALDKFLEEFDIAPPDGVPESRPDVKAEPQAGAGATAESAPETAPETAPVSDAADTATGDAAGDKSEQPQPEVPVSRESEQQPVAPAPPPDTRKLVREYESQGIKYYLFDDGSVDAHAPTGIFRFSSLEELRAYIEERNR